MSGRGVTEHDVAWFVYGIKRIRSETHGASVWDDAGIVTVVRELVGTNFAIALERCFAHAADPEAKTPGAIRRPFTPKLGMVKAERFHPLKKEEQCLTCGQRLDLCPSIGCGEKRTRPTRREAGEPPPGLQAARSQIQPMRPTRGGKS